VNEICGSRLERGILHNNKDHGLVELRLEVGQVDEGEMVCGRGDVVKYMIHP